MKPKYRSSRRTVGYEHTKAQAAYGRRRDFGIVTFSIPFFIATVNYAQLKVVAGTWGVLES
jgi:hypothetical protein